MSDIAEQCKFDDMKARAERAESACAEMRALLEEWADELRHTYRPYGSGSKTCAACGAELANHEDHKEGCVVEKTNTLLDSSSQGQGWHSPEEAAAKDTRIAELEQQLAKALRERNIHFNQVQTGCKNLNEAVLENERLKQQLAETRKDSERLDYLSARCYLPDDQPDLNQSADAGLYVVVSESIAPMGAFTCEIEHDRSEFRTAIDNAKGDK